MSRTSAARRLAASLLGRAQAGAGAGAFESTATAAGTRSFASKTGGGGVRPGEPSPAIKAAVGPKGVIDVSCEKKKEGLRAVRCGRASRRADWGEKNTAGVRGRVLSLPRRRAAHAAWHASPTTPIM